MTTTKTCETLVKFVDSKYCNDLRNGKLYLNTVDFFRKCESNVHIDSYEGIDHIYQADKIKSVIVDNGKGNKISLNKNNGLLNCKMSTVKNCYTNIFCMYIWKISETFSAPVDNRLFAFGDTALIFFDSDEFLRRLTSAINNKKYNFGYGAVEYIDENIYSGDVGLFKKRNCFEFMREFRIAISAEMDNKPLELFIGDISDISVVIKSHDINDAIINFVLDCTE